MNSSKGLYLQDSFGSRRDASVAPVRSAAVPASEPIWVGSEMIPLLHKAELFSNAAGSSTISYVWKDKKYTAAVSERTKKMWQEQPCRHQSERRRRGEGTQALDQVPLPFMEDNTRPSIPTAAYRESRFCSLTSKEIWQPGNFTHYRFSNQKEISPSWIIIQRGCQCFSARVGTIIKRSIYCMCSETQKDKLDKKSNKLYWIPGIYLNQILTICRVVLCMNLFKVYSEW